MFHLSFIMNSVLQKSHLKTPYTWYRCKSTFMFPGYENFDLVGSVEEDLSVNLYGISNFPERAIGNEDFNAIKSTKTPNYYKSINNSRIVFKTDVGRNNDIMIVKSEVNNPGFTYLELLEGNSQVCKKKNYYASRAYCQIILDRNPGNDIVGGKWVNSPFQKGNSISTPYYKCPRWPDEVDGWISRNRPSGWPDMTLIRRTTEVPCVITSACHIPSSENPDIEWMFDFSFPEKFLLKDHITPEQRYCFHVFKLLIDFHTGRRKELSTFILKTIFLYTLEVIPKCHWSSCPSACVLYMVESLLRGLKEKKIPHYFIPQNNIISYIGSEIIYILIEKVNIVREYPIMSIVLMAEGHGVMTTNVTDKIIEDVSHKRSKSVQDSILNSVIPTYKELAVSSLASENFKQAANAITTGYKILQDLSVSDPSSSPSKNISLHMFIQDAARDMQMYHTWWLCFFVDLFKHENTTSSFVKTNPFIKIGDILEDCSQGDLDDIPVPDYVVNFCRVSVDPKKIRECAFLNIMCVRLIREGELRHAAHYLRGLIKEMTKTLDNPDAMIAQLLQEQAHRGEDGVDYIMQTVMSSVYDCLFYFLHNLYVCYSHAGQTEYFQEYVEQFEFVCNTLATPQAYQYLTNVWMALGNTKKMRQAQQKLG